MSIGRRFGAPFGLQIDMTKDMERYMEGPRVIWCPDKQDYIEDPKGIPTWEFWQYD